jgi:hypothetical protein
MTRPYQVETGSTALASRRQRARSTLAGQNSTSNFHLRAADGGRLDSATPSAIGRRLSAPFKSARHFLGRDQFWRPKSRSHGAAIA